MEKLTYEEAARWASEQNEKGLDKFCPTIDRDCEGQKCVFFKPSVPVNWMATMWRAEKDEKNEWSFTSPKCNMVNRE